MEDSPHLIQQQIAYYQARASEHDQWFLHQGRYDHGPANYFLFGEATLA